MINSRHLAFSLVILCCVVVISEAKEWHGIVPLKSTRTDVERLLGKPNAKYDRYLIGNEEIDITYSGDRCVNGWDVARDTVISIAVSPGGRPSLSDLQPDLSKFTKEADTHIRGRVYYVDAIEGIRYHVQEQDTGKDIVIIVYYLPSTKDNRLRCVQSIIKPTRSANNPHCPLISVACSASTGGNYNCAVNFSGSRPIEKLRYKWKISNGSLISGDATHSVVVTPTCEKHSSVLTVEIVGLTNECPNTASYLIDCSKVARRKRPADIFGCS
jgi:hypothetical protein